MIKNLNSSKSVNPKRPAIVHIVTWRLNGETPDKRSQQACEIVNVFEASRAEFQGLLRMELGYNIIEAEEAEEAWDVALYMLFENREYLELYQSHSAHQRIKAVVGPMRTSRGQVDFEILM